MKPRPYQQEGIDLIRKSYGRKTRRVLYVLPTGGGKTVTFSCIAAGAAIKGTRTWIVAHRRELVNQASKTLTSFGINHGVMIPNSKQWTESPVQVCSLQTLVGRMGKEQAPDFIVYDEAHHATSGSYDKIMKHFPDAKILGVTATPCRTDGRGLGDVFEELIIGPSTEDLTNEGYLSSARYFCSPRIADLSGIAKRGGDYEREALAEAMDQKLITGDAIEHYKRHCDGVPMIVFCVSVEHAKHVASEYIIAGYRATYVDGQLSDEERAYRLTGLGDGTFQVVTSCDLIGEGLDIPNVVAAQLLRPTESTGLHMQQIGRPLRPVYAAGMPLDSAGDRLAAIANGVKPYSIILDHVGNCGSVVNGQWMTKHGFATSPREWSLNGKKKKPKLEPDVLIKSCPDCFSVHSPAACCPFCGHIYQVVKSRTVEISKGELVEIKAQEALAKKQEEKKVFTLKDLTELGRSRGYKNPEFWARMKIKGRKNIR